ncbi:MAG: HEAT repeat domain-containing protein [Pseudomonadota bacterium]
MRKVTDPLEASPTNEELQAVKDVIAAFLIALKNYALYPENHAICEKAIANAAKRIDYFLKIHGHLKFDVEKDRLIYKKEVVFQDPAGGENLAFLLFRDGIQRLEFLAGLEFKEIKGLLKILNKYKVLQEEAAGDMVTALWEADFPNLRYKATEIYWESESLLDLSLLSTGEAEHNGIDDFEPEQDSSLSMTSHSTEHALWKLAAEETEKLREMILEDERRDSVRDLLDVLIVLLHDQSEKTNSIAILEFLEEEIQDTLAKGEFRFVLKLLIGLYKIRDAYKNRKPWTRPILDHFFMRLSSPRVLNVLSDVWTTLDSLDSDRIKLLRQFLLLLPSNALLALGPMLAQVQSLDTQQQLMEIIGIMAKRDLRPLERLLAGPDEFVVQKLVHILGGLEGEKSTQILLKMLKHSSDRVRKQALKELIDRDVQMLNKFFHLIEDPDDSIRRLMLKNLGEKRSESAEDLLLDYLEKRRFRLADQKHLLDCYRVLGKCGSKRSMPFLRKLLLNRAWIPDFGRSVHRRGAAVALMALGTEETKEILYKASRSLFPSVRIAYRKALEASQ